MKQIVFFRKMYSNQEMVDYGNKCSQNQISWVGIGALEGH